MEAIGLLLEAVADGRAVSQATSEEMLEIMKACKTGKKRLRGQLPGEVVLAHKTGTQYQRACNVGVLYVTADRPVVVAACVKGVTNLARSERVLSKVGKAIYDVILANPLPEATEPEPAGEEPVSEPSKETPGEQAAAAGN